MFQDPINLAVVKAVVMSELRVRVNQLKMEMEMAVAEQDFMKAHKVKQAILKVEEEMKKEKDEEVVDVSNASISSTPIRKKQPPTPATSRTVIQVATPESASSSISSRLPTHSNPSKKLASAMKVLGENGRRKMADLLRSYINKDVKKGEEKVDIDENTGSFGTFHKGRDTRLAPLVRGRDFIDLLRCLSTIMKFCTLISCR